MKAFLTIILLGIALSVSGQHENKDTAVSKNQKVSQSDFEQVHELPYHLIYEKNNNQKGLVFFISGDGGFTGFDMSISNEFAQRGYPVIGLDARKYFWERKEASVAVEDIQKLLSYYENLLHKSELIFVGYSFGADAIPVIVNRLDPSFKQKTKVVGLFSPSPSADLEIHVADMLSLKHKGALFDVAYELNNISFAPVICIYGDNEKEVVKDAVSNPKVEIVSVKGGHHFDRDCSKLVELVLQKKK